LPFGFKAVVDFAKRIVKIVKEEFEGRRL